MKPSQIAGVIILLVVTFCAAAGIFYEEGASAGYESGWHAARQSPSKCCEESSLLTMERHLGKFWVTVLPAADSGPWTGKDAKFIYFRVRTGGQPGTFDELLDQGVPQWLGYSGGQYRLITRGYSGDGAIVARYDWQPNGT